MKVVFPHMGNMYIALRALLEGLGVDVVVPPKSSRRTLELGMLHSPEFACLPLKLNIGNFIEGFELGADTIVMGGGIGPCRFGYYGEVEREILRDLDYDFEMVIIEPPQGRIGHILERIRYITGGIPLTRLLNALRIAWAKINAVDALEKKASEVRAFEIGKGDATRALGRGLKEIDSAVTARELAMAKEAAEAWLDAVPVDRGKDALRIGIVGEVYVVLEPFANGDTERLLGEMGVIVDRSIYIGDWVRNNLFSDIFGIGGGKKIRELAKPYLNHFVGGHGIETIGETVYYACRGYDGVIQLLPFTCMPEIVAQSILPRVSADFGIPSMTLVLDEHSGDAGFVTRLEAFVDMLEERRRKEGRRGVQRGSPIREMISASPSLLD